MQGRERFFVRAADTNTKENAMQAVLDFINNHVRDIFIPLTALALLRVGMCLAQLKRMTHLREKKGAYHAVRGHCEELGVWFGALAGLLLPVIVPGLWYVGLALAIVGGVIGQRIGVKKGRALDDIYREVAWELKHEAEAEAAREAAAHTLTPGAEELPETDEQNETTEDKGETENG